VAAINKYGQSPYATEVTGYISAPLLISVSAVSNGVQIQWNQLTYLTNYTIYRSLDSNFNYQNTLPIATVSGNSYTDVLSNNGVYSYIVVGTGANGIVVVSAIQTIYYQSNFMNTITTPQNLGIILGVGGAVAADVIIFVVHRIHQKRLYGF
jgi:hypothetical protein